MGNEVKLRAADIGGLMTLVGEVAEKHQCTSDEAVEIIRERAGERRPKVTRVKLGQFVANVRMLRMRRCSLFGAPLFRDPVWDMLLELYAAHENNRDISVSSLCLASGVPSTTALRHIDRMEKYGMIYREGDKSDDRRCFVRPTEKSLQGVATAAALLAEQAHRATMVWPDEEGGPVGFTPSAAA